MVQGGVLEAWAHHRRVAGSSHPGEARAGSVGHARFVRQLLLYGFGPDAEFEGRLVGALERLESGGALRILDVLFVRRDAETGNIDAIDLHGDGAGGVVAPLLNFRLDAAERGRATERALRAEADIVGELGAALGPGDALAAVLVDHVWSSALDDAVARTGGTLLTSDFVDAAALGELGSELLAAVRRSAG
jgi:hypothetical protein